MSLTEDLLKMSPCRKCPLLPCTWTHSHKDRKLWNGALWNSKWDRVFLYWWVGTNSTKASTHQSAKEPQKKTNKKEEERG